MGKFILFVALNILYYYERAKSLQRQGGFSQFLKLIFGIYGAFVLALIIYQAKIGPAENQDLKQLVVALACLRGLMMAYNDYRTGNFYLCDLYWLLGHGIFYLFLEKNYWIVFGSLFTYLFFYGIEKIFHGFGNGDKDFAATLALFSSTNMDTYFYLTASFVLAGLVAVFGIVFFKWQRSKKISFGPFIMAGWILMKLWKGA